MKRYKPFERLVHTPDNWFPTINGKVEAIVCRDDSTTVRVAVYGGGDTGLEREWKFRVNWEAEEFFHQKIEEVSRWKSITMASLISDGFVTA